MTTAPGARRPLGRPVHQPPFFVLDSGPSCVVAVIFTALTPFAVADFGSGGRNAARSGGSGYALARRPTQGGFPKPLPAPV